MSYEINYDDQRFKDVEADKKEAISDIEKTYSGMISDSDGYYNAQIDATKEWEKKQTDIQNQQTEFAIEKIEQEKDQAKKDYTKEQSGAYVDWQKQSDQYGARAEQIADNGMQNTGYSESAQVSMYNTYQKRVATAREAYSRAVLDFNNAITEARLQNNSALAEIAYNALQQRLELSLYALQYKNQLLLEKSNRKTELEQIYHERWQDVLDQMNTENALAEEIRQFNEQMEWEKYVYEQSRAKSSGGGGGGGSYKKKSGSSKKTGSAKVTGGEGETINKAGTSSAEDKSFMQSVLDLGKGPISASNLANQVSTGDVVLAVDSKTGNPTVVKGTPGSDMLYSKNRLKEFRR